MWSYTADTPGSLFPHLDSVKQATVNKKDTKQLHININQENAITLQKSWDIYIRNKETRYPASPRRQWQPTPVLLPGKSHGRRSLVGCSPLGREESDTTEWLHFHFSVSCIGEGNGNPLQCSCLENSRDGGAWWAAIYGVAQSRTRLKRLSSSSRYPASWASPIAWQLKNPPDVQGTQEMDSIPGSGRSHGGGRVSPLQDSCLENHHAQRILEGHRVQHDWVPMHLTS